MNSSRIDFDQDSTRFGQQVNDNLKYGKQVQQRYNIKKVLGHRAIGKYRDDIPGGVKLVSEHSGSGKNQLGAQVKKELKRKVGHKSKQVFPKRREQKKFAL